MTKRDMQVAVVAILETLAETADGWAPETMCYLPLVQTMNITLQDWYVVRGIMERTGFVTCEHDTVLITDKGRDIIKRIAADRAAARAAKEKT